MYSRSVYKGCSGIHFINAKTDQTCPNVYGISAVSEDVQVIETDRFIQLGMFCDVGDEINTIANALDHGQIVFGALDSSRAFEQAAPRTTMLGSALKSSSLDHE